MVAFCSTEQKSHWLFCVGSLDCEQISKLESVLPDKRKKIRFYVYLMKKWEPLHLTCNNSKSEEGQGNH